MKVKNKRMNHLRRKYQPSLNKRVKNNPRLRLRNPLQKAKLILKLQLKLSLLLLKLRVKAQVMMILVQTNHHQIHLIHQMLEA